MGTRIALDAMGGDYAPEVAIQGAIEAFREANGTLELVLVGQADRIGQLLREHEARHLPVEVVDAADVIGMEEAPATAVKQKRNSSIHVGLGLHREGRVDAFLSAGNTGAVMAASLFILGRISDLARPSIPAYFPTTQGACIVMDVGANVDCRPEHLVQFARMGSVFVERVLHRPNPIVALLNVGEEPGKGNETAKATYKLLSDASDVNFRGNIEGRDILHHAADVVICDGFVGNIMLKLGESMTTALRQMVAEEMQRRHLPAEQQALVGGVLGAVQKRFDYQEYGGVPLLGVNGNVLIGHGGSTARAFRQMILTAAEIVHQNIPGSIAAALEN